MLRTSVRSGVTHFNKFVRGLELSDASSSICEQEFVGSTLRTTRVNFLGARGIEAVVTVDHFRQCFLPSAIGRS